MSRTTCLALGALLLATTTACSRTAPESQWPPPGPRAGLPYIPLPSNDEDIFGLEQEQEAPETPAAGAVFNMPKGVKHSFSPSGTSRLLALQLYTPSGAERRFVKLAEASKVPAAK